MLSLMTDATIVCPQCGAEIPLTEAVTHRLREQPAAEQRALIKQWKAREKQIQKVLRHTAEHNCF